MEILLALAAAVAYGVSDFAGGVHTRRAHVFVVLLLSQLVSFALLLVVVALWADAVSWPGGLGAAAGLAGVVGTSLLYQGLAIGRMSVVAPITGVLGAGLPVLFGLAVGERPGPAALAGIVLGLVAVVVITRAPDAPAVPDRSGEPSASPDEAPEASNLSPQALNGTTVRINLLVADPDQFCERAIAIGAVGDRADRGPDLRAAPRAAG
jgi:EamA-like transporter family